MSTRYDLVIIGLGSAGLTAAEFAARELDLRVAAVERDRIGGDCLWTGCVPSKALLASARVAHQARHAADFGVLTGPVSVDRAAVWRRLKAIQQHIADTSESPDHIEQFGVDLHFGAASITGYREVTVTDEHGDAEKLSTRYILVCTGSRPRVPDIAGLAAASDAGIVHTTESIFEIDEPPESLVVLGGGPIGVELSQALARVGVATTLLHSGPRLLPREEPELSDRLLGILRRDGVTIELGASTTSVEHSDGEVTVNTAAGSHHAAGLLLATGRTANVEGLELERLGIPVNADGITVSDNSQTLVPSIYAVGDVAAGRPNFTHLAAHDSVLAVRDMFFPGSGISSQLVPWATFTDPELAHVGKTAAEARAIHGDRVKVRRYDLANDDRALADGAADGVLMVVTNKDRIVGAHALSPHAGELIHELALAIRFEIGIDELARLVHLYPTYSDGIGRLAGERAYETGQKYKLLTKLGRWFD